MRKPLSDATIRAMQPPAKGYRILWDSLPGFGCRISQAGTRAFVVLVASGRPATIGRYPPWTLAAARAEAKKRLAQKTLGKITPTRTAFDDARADFLKDCEKRNKPRTVRDYRRLLTKHYPFGRQSVVDITGRDILNRIKHLPGSERHHAFTAGRRFFRYCVQNHLIDRSPLSDAAVSPAGRPRTRVLSEDELRAVWKSARSLATPFHAIVALLILGGQRRSEVAALQWDWIDGDRVHVPGAYVKNGRDQVYPIGPESQAILASLPRLSETYVFPAMRQSKPTTTVFNGWGKPMARFRAELGDQVKPFVLHDLRRVFASGMQRLGVRLEVTESLLGHVSGTRAGIVGVYQVYRYEDEKREAIRQWEAYLASLSSLT